VVSSTPQQHFSPGKDPVPILQEAGWAPGRVWTGGKSRPHRDSIPDHPACSQSLHQLSYLAHFQCLYLPKFVTGKYTKISETSFMPFATIYSPDPPVKRFLYHHNLPCFLIPRTCLTAINIQQHIQTSPSTAVKMYKHFQTSPISMDVCHSIYSLVHLHIFCQFAIYSYVNFRKHVSFLLNKWGVHFHLKLTIISFKSYVIGVVLLLFVLFFVICVVLFLFALFYVLSVCKCVL